MMLPDFHRASLSLFFVILLLLPSVSAMAASAADPAEGSVARSLEDFNKTSEELYRYASEGKLEQALTTMKLLEKQATSMSFAGATGLEGVEALFASIIEMKRSLAAIHPDRREIARNAARLRLAADALAGKPQPMWHQYYNVLRNDLDAMRTANRDKQAEALRASYAQLKEHYQMIRPSILISFEASQNEKWVSLLASLDQAVGASVIRHDQVETLLPGLGALIDETFGREHEAAFVPVPDSERPVLVTVLIGSIIIAVLAYVGWLKYRNDQGYVNISGRNNRPRA
mgnify:CR=1 FL=1